MPIFEFHCNSCDKEFEEKINSKAISITCPLCNSNDIKNLFPHLALEVQERGGLKHPHQVRAAHAHQETAALVLKMTKG